MKKVPGEVMVFLAALLWSLIGLLVKSVDVSASWLLFVRALVAFLVLLPFAFKPRIRPVKFLVIAGVFYTMFCVSFIWAARLGSSAMAISMQYAAPAYLMAYSMIKNRSPGGKLIPFILLVIGIGLNVGSAASQVPFVAILCGVGTGLSFLFYGYFLKKVDTGSPLGIISLINLISALICGAMLPLDFYPRVDSLATVGVLVVSGIVISALSYVLYRIGLSKTSLERAMLISLSEMVLNPIWVLLFVGEKPPAITVVALVFILCGAVCDIVFSKKKETPDGPAKSQPEIKEETEAPAPNP